MTLMPTRHQYLVNAFLGYHETGVPLVEKAGGIYRAAGLSDDKGIYYFIPQIAKILGLSVDQSVALFFGFFIFLGWAIGTACFFFLFEKLKSRLFGLMGMSLLAGLTYLLSDVYVFLMFAVASLVPLWLLLRRINPGFGPGLLGAIAFSGLAAGYCNFCRVQSGTGALIFILLFISLNFPWAAKTKVFSALGFVIFFLMPYGHFHHLMKQRDAFLTEKVPGYQTAPAGHPFWHSIYIGLGYLPNPYGIQYLDENAYQKVASIDPKATWMSVHYLEILKTQVWEIAKKDPLFILRLVLAKSLRLLLLFIVSANVGLLACFFLRPPWRLLLPFMAAGLFYALPGILVVPGKLYVLGMISTAVVFGIYMTGTWLDLKEFKLGKGGFH